MSADVPVTAVPAQRFLGRTQLVSDAEDYTFPVCRRAQIQREHMPENHVPFNFPKGEIPGGIFPGLPGVKKSVKAVALVRHMPVIEKIVVQQGAPD